MNRLSSSHTSINNLIIGRTNQISREKNTTLRSSQSTQHIFKAHIPLERVSWWSLFSGSDEKGKVSFSHPGLNEILSYCLCALTY